MVVEIRELQNIWVIHEVLPRGVTLLAGAGERDLLLAALKLSATVADGRRLLTGGDHELGMPTAQGRVLYLALDAATAHARLATLLPADRLTARLTLAEWSPFGEWPALAERVAELPELRLLIIDPLIRARAHRDDALEFHALPYRILEGLRRLALHAHLAIVLYHPVPGRLRHADDAPTRLLARSAGPVDCVAWFHSPAPEGGILSLAHRGRPPRYLPLRLSEGDEWTLSSETVPVVQ